MAYFDGETYNHERDGDRLNAQQKRIFNLMRDGRWRTLWEIQRDTMDPQSSISARLRDFRKERFGGHTVEKRYIHDGLWEYRLLVNKAAA